MQIQRSVGFEKVKKQLNCWNAVVEANRVSDQLKYPLSQSNICFETTDDFVEKLKVSKQSVRPAEVPAVSVQHLL